MNDKEEIPPSFVYGQQVAVMPDEISKNPTKKIIARKSSFLLANLNSFL